METATIAALYSESDWPVLGQALAKAENGDPPGIFALADAYNGRDDDGTFNTLFQSFPVIQCASGIASPPPDDPEALAATLRAEAPRFAKDFTAADLDAGGRRRATSWSATVKPGADLVLRRRTHRRRSVAPTTRRRRFAGRRR